MSASPNEQKKSNGDGDPAEDHAWKWEVEPHPYSTDFDILVTDDDQEACQAAQDAIEHLWDQMEAGDEAVVKIRMLRK